MIDVTNQYFANKFSLPGQNNDRLRLATGDYVNCGGQKYQITAAGSRYVYMKSEAGAIHFAKLAEVSKWIDVQEEVEHLDNFEENDDYSSATYNVPNPDLFNEIRSKMEAKAQEVGAVTADENTEANILREQVAQRLMEKQADALGQVLNNKGGV